MNGPWPALCRARLLRSVLLALLIGVSFSTADAGLRHQVYRNAATGELASPKGYKGKSGYGMRVGDWKLVRQLRHSIFTTIPYFSRIFPVFFQLCGTYTYTPSYDIPSFGPMLADWCACDPIWRPLHGAHPGGAALLVAGHGAVLTGPDRDVPPADRSL